MKNQRNTVIIGVYNQIVAGILNKTEKDDQTANLLSRKYRLTAKREVQKQNLSLHSIELLMNYIEAKTKRRKRLFNIMLIIMIVISIVTMIVDCLKYAGKLDQLLNLSNSWYFGISGSVILAWMLYIACYFETQMRENARISIWQICFEEINKEDSTQHTS